jgi:hypothetical protein
MKTIIELPPLPNLTDAERQANIDKTIKYLLDSKRKLREEILEEAKRPEFIERLKAFNEKNS